MVAVAAFAARVVFVARGRHDANVVVAAVGRVVARVRLRAPYLALAVRHGKK